jgi:PPOX class probable F420-dependent enzyme
MSEPHAIPDSHRDLTDHHIGILSTIGPSGHPQSTAIWFILGDDGVLRTSLLDSRQKTKNMSANPKATLFVLDSKNPYRSFEARCDVTIVDDPGVEFMRRIVTYFGQDFETFHAPRVGRVVVELTPRHVVTNG